VFGSPILASVYALFLAAVGCGVGTVESLALSSALKSPKREAWKDAVLGACGMVGGFLLCAIVPWPQNTVTYKIGDTMVSSTMRSFQHPYYVAFALSVALPLMRGLLKARRQNRGATSN
jgi:hypothetical protein